MRPTCASTSRGDRYGVHVAVEDRGVGIPDEARDHVFRPFFTTKAQGTGLGLASSRAIAELHEGTLDFANVAGGGTRFWSASARQRQR